LSAFLNDRGDKLISCFFPSTNTIKKMDSDTRLGCFWGAYGFSIVGRYRKIIAAGATDVAYLIADSRYSLLRPM
jgi:hypothetical protein